MAQLVGNIAGGDPEAPPPLANSQAPDDGTTEHTGTTDEPAPDPSGQDRGWLLTSGEKEVREHVLALMRDQMPFKRRRAALEQYWERMRAGETGLSVVQAENDDYAVRVDLSADDSGGATDSNKLDQLINRTAAVLCVDEHLPEVTGASTKARQVLGAEFAQRFLRVEGSEANKDDAGQAFNAVSNAGTYGTHTTLTIINPKGGGLHPVEVDAHPDADRLENALTVPNPATGTTDPRPPAEIKKRYVMADEAETLTDVQAEARQEWRPSIERRELDPAQVWFLPAGASLKNATGAIVGEIITVSELRARLGDRVDLTDDVLKKCAGHKFGEFNQERWLPMKLRHLLQRRDVAKLPGDQGAVSPFALVPLVTYYQRSVPEAPFGACIALSGPEGLLYREEWRGTVGEGDDRRTEGYPLPLSTLTWRADPMGDPFGIPGTDDLGPEANTRATAWQYVLNDMWQKGNAHHFLPIGSTFQEDEYMARSGRPIRIPPDQQPFREQFPPLDAVITDVLERTDSGMESTSGLNSVSASGQTAPNVNSAKQFQFVQSESRVAITGLKQSLEKYLCRLWRNEITFARVGLTKPFLLSYVGNGGQVLERELQGLDFQGAGDVSIAPASGTMMSQAAKAAAAAEQLQLAATVGDPDALRKYMDILATHQDASLGVSDDPVRMRVTGQVARWEEEAREEHEPAPEPVPNPNYVAPAPLGMAPPIIPGQDAVGAPGPTGAPVIPPAGPIENSPDPMANPIAGAMPGAPMPGAMPAPEPPTITPPDPVQAQADAIFDDNPGDTMPNVAQVRYRALLDLVQSESFAGADPRYKNTAVREFFRMKSAAGVQTLDEQAKAQAAAQAQQQQQAQQQAQSLALQKHQQGLDAANQAHGHKMQQTAAAAPPIAPPLDSPPPEPPML